MKFYRLPLFLFLFITVTATAQLTYLGEDAPQAKFDGYANKKLAGGLVASGGSFYFTTPNGRLYRTDGTAAGTKVLASFPKSDGLFLAATARYLYYAADPEGSGAMNVLQYDLQKGALANTLYTPDPSSRFTLNGVTVPGTKETVDEVFTAPDGSAVYYRIFKNDKFRLYSIDDRSPAKLMLVKEGYMPTAEFPDVTIAVGSKPGFIRDEVYINGRVKGNKKNIYETSVSATAPDPQYPGYYKFVSDYRLLDKGVEVYNGFLRTDTALYSLIKYNTGEKNECHMLLKYNINAKALTGRQSLPAKETDYAAEVLNKKIYISYKGRLVKYDEGEEDYKDIISDGTSIWEKVNERHRFLTAGGAYLYRTGGSPGVYDPATRKRTSLSGAVVLPEPNRYDYGSRWAYATANCFYYFNKAGDAAVFTRYHPGKDSYHPIPFPEYKKEKFDEVKAVFQQGDRFLLLVSYTDKKERPVYRMFMYTEEN